MGDIMREDILELDLNQEPTDSHGSIRRLESFLSELENAHEQIEERIRQLEAVNIRARQREQAQAPRVVSTSITMSTEGNNEETSVDAQQTTVDNSKTRKRDRTHLIAKALAMDTGPKEVGSSSGGFFDCNICLDMARNPIVTCCGHLFCWPCFYQVTYVHSDVKECPVCKGEVKDTSIVPIYGNGNSNNSHQSEVQDSGSKVPPRPHAQRVESVRQQLFNLGSSSSRLEERIQRFNNMVGALGIAMQPHHLDAMQVRAENTDISAAPYHVFQSSPALDMASYQPQQSFQVSSLLLQGAVSFSSLSSALDSAMLSAARLVQDLETYIQSRRIRRTLQRSPSVDDLYSFSGFAAVIQSPQVSVVPIAASSLRSSRNVPTAAINLENQTTNTAINSTIPSSSSRRRTDVPRVPDAGNGVAGRSRRRRMR